jgi:LPS export ABC transporter protein LptC
MTAAVLLTGCSSNDSPGSGQSSSADTGRTPDAELEQAKIYLYDGGRVTTEILSERIVEFEPLDSSMSYGVHVTTYDSVGKPNGWVIADSAVVHEKSGLLDLYGHVVLVNERQTRLKTEYLHWNSETDRMETEAYVDIMRGEDWVTGWGLEADGKLNWYHIKKVDEVHGDLSNIGDFGER